MYVAVSTRPIRHAASADGSFLANFTIVGDGAVPCGNCQKQDQNCHYRPPREVRPVRPPTIGEDQSRSLNERLRSVEERLLRMSRPLQLPEEAQASSIPPPSHEAAIVLASLHNQRGWSEQFSTSTTGRTHLDLNEAQSKSATAVPPSPSSLSRSVFSARNTLG